MKSLFLLLLLPALASAQNAADMLKQGEQVFTATCASGYCHGAQGVGGGAPRIAARGFDQTFIANTVTRGIPNTGMQSFANSLSRTDLTAVVAYVAKLNGIASPVTVPNTPAPPAPVLSAGAQRGRELFSDAARSFGRCSTCHELNGIGIPVAAPITIAPESVMALKALATPRVSTASVSGDSMPALLLARKSQTVTIYDLTTAPPVLRTETAGAVQIRDNSSWRHVSVIGSYNDSELSSILEYLRAVTR
jgi:mono/diheme cytochrome c family protein